MKEQLTINTASRTSDWQIFAKRKSAVKCHRSTVKCHQRGFTPTPMLVQFRFLKILSLGITTVVQGVISERNDGETKKPHQHWCRGFTLVEMIIYIAFFALLSTLAVEATLVVMKSFYTLRLTQSVNQSATVALERLSREIRNAYDFDATQSTFGTSPGRLMLNTKDSVGANTTIEFYMTGNQLGLREGGADKGALVTKSVSIPNLIFRSIATANSKAIKIEATIQDSRSTITQTVKFYDTIVLRGSVH